ncbi:glycoside hydrolase family 15 protein [Homoserinibacter sp. GY 40078]|uniref:glycoside hydrolase family 15 protein n=1 Tax=Homoserinibacter sp. GY 40078 TaxID=2603275 RepID=UPI0011C7F066|nr:glycoside hydrolase family 15 protein [Homoserinibacter sp. GY 40078]TXK19702.1 glycoside hydrolase family 15 [Homoserinibacter sp. GY 40078]
MTEPLADREHLLEIARRSHEVIRRYQDSGGAYPASPSFSAYRGYSWLRDGAFIAEGMSRYGDAESADAFHDWVAERLAERRDEVDELILRRAAGEQLAPADMLPTRFAIAPDAGADEWWNFQTDGYGMWLWAVEVHATRHGRDLDRWRTGIEVATDYAAAFWDVPCYDWWEENVDKRHGSTLGALYAGLAAAADMAILDGARRAKARASADASRTLALDEGVAGSPPRLTKWLGGDQIDASLAACVVPFGLVAPGDPIGAATLDEIRARLDVGGGVHRYLADQFFGGGLWLLLSCLVGWNEAATGDRGAALARLRWTAAQLTAEGEFPEQVPTDLLNPEYRDEWVANWGPVATPLLWSHGMYLILADELGVTSR